MQERYLKTLPCLDAWHSNLASPPFCLFVYRHVRYSVSIMCPSLHLFTGQITGLFSFCQRFDRFSVIQCPVALFLASLKKSVCMTKCLIHFGGSFLLKQILSSLSERFLPSNESRLIILIRKASMLSEIVFLVNI